MTSREYALLLSFAPETCELYVLLGKRHRRAYWCDLGGHSEPTDAGWQDTLARELGEETLGTLLGPAGRHDCRLNYALRLPVTDAHVNVTLIDWDPQLIDRFHEARQAIERLHLQSDGPLTDSLLVHDWLDVDNLQPYRELDELRWFPLGVLQEAAQSTHGILTHSLTELHTLQFSFRRRIRETLQRLNDHTPPLQAPPPERQAGP